ncbi:MAG: helix-turn-helix domain-containing protein [Chryseolinea sp.]
MRDLQYNIFEPVPALRDLVRFFWSFEGIASHENPYVLRTVANGCPELLFHYKGAFQELTIDGCHSSFITGVHGQANAYRRFIVREPFGIFGVYLYPYALDTIFGIPGMEFTNQLPDLELVLGTESARFIDTMHLATDNHQRQRIITDFLIRRKQPLKQTRIAHAVQTMLLRKGLVDIYDLGAQYFRSHRQFERDFKEHTGFTAKTYSRIIRFNALMQRPHHTHSSLTQIALDFGYYDQSHFIHDFKMFSGYSPRAYFSGSAEELL